MGEIKVIPVCSAVICDSDKYLLVQSGEKNYVGKWGLPGGKINPAEDPKDAIKREVCEETGYLVNNLGLFGIYCSFPNSNLGIWVVNFAYAGGFVGVAREPDGEEILNMRWCSYDEIRKMYETDLIRTRDNFKIITDSREMIKVYGLEKKLVEALCLEDHSGY